MPVFKTVSLIFWASEGTTTPIRLDSRSREAAVERGSAASGGVMGHDGAEIRLAVISRGTTSVEAGTNGKNRPEDDEADR